MLKDMNEIPSNLTDWSLYGNISFDKIALKDKNEYISVFLKMLMFK
jgi:hypothetical protein